jgi:hypothetical protein
MAVSIRIAPAQEQSVELWFGNRSRRVDWKEIEALASAADREYFGDGHAESWNPKFPQLKELGHRLYRWLDGPDGWLRAASCSGVPATIGLILGIEELLQMPFGNSISKRGVLWVFLTKA